MQTTTILVSSQVKMLVFEHSPKSLNENIIQSSAFGIHTDLYPIVYQYLKEMVTGELTALIGVEDFRFAPLA